MRLPGKSGYISWIQLPDIVFADPEFRDGRADYHSSGQPLFGSGKFAIVFSFRKSTGERVALRCFDMTCITDEEMNRLCTRYHALNKQLNEHPVKSFVNFEFRDDLFQLQNCSFPALVMDWVEGCPLDEFVAHHYEDRARLLRLATSWQEVMLQLEEAGIAHNDLHHGNILVDEKRDDKIYLIDYDATFVPAISNIAPDELGHPNYQHPDREVTNHFAPNSDVFSFLVIYTSLRAIAADPRVWEKYNSGGDNLIFRKNHFENYNAGIWLRLSSSPDPVVRKLTSKLKSFCNENLAALPPNSSLLDNRLRAGSGYPTEQDAKEARWTQLLFMVPRLRSTFTRLSNPVAEMVQMTANMHDWPDETD